MIYETIVTTLDAENNPYIAPFGIREENGLVVISPYRPSKTLDNLLQNKCAVLNLTDDVRIFAGVLTGRRNWTGHRAHTINGFVLDGVLSHRELVLDSIREDAIRPALYFRVEYELTHLPFRGFNRAQGAIIELSVLASRLDRLPMEKIEADLAYLNIAIEKTAGPREQEAWGWLVEHIENYKAAQEGKNIA